MAEVDYRTTGVVTAPISLKAVAQLLGEKPDVAAVCRSSHINMWAKYRPMRHSALFGLTDAQRAAIGWGISIPVFNSLALLRTAFFNGTADWQALLPRGKDTYNEPFRLGDFISSDNIDTYHGYDHQAHATAWGSTGQQGGYWNSPLGVSVTYGEDDMHALQQVTAMTDYEDTESPNTVQFSDLAAFQPAAPAVTTPLDHWYFGLALISESDTATYWTTSIYQIGSAASGTGGNFLRAKLPENMAAADWWLVPILSTAKTQTMQQQSAQDTKSYFSPGTTGKFCIIGQKQYLTARGYNPYYIPLAIVWGAFSQSGANTSVSLTITPDDVAITSIYAIVAHTMYDEGDAYGSAELDYDTSRWTFTDGKVYYQTNDSAASTNRVAYCRRLSPTTTNQYTVTVPMTSVNYDVARPLTAATTQVYLYITYGVNKHYTAYRL